MDDYEPFWKWNARITTDLNKNVVLEKYGPKGGYYDSKALCVEEILMEIDQMDFLDAEEVRKKLYERIHCYEK